jgi:glyoxylase-like metal-dependent hydrolase (beta-lactamase superfamily II)
LNFVITTNGKDTSLTWDVFITLSIPIRTNTPPNTKETLWYTLSSTLIYGKRDAVLVDTFLTVKQSHDLVKWVVVSGKNLTTIYITHGHGDHCLGIGAFSLRNAIDLEGNELRVVELGHSYTEDSMCLYCDRNETDR